MTPTLTLECILVMPAYNESECIETVVSTWRETLKGVVGDAFKMVVVNDGSKDNTGTLLDALSRKFSELVVIHQKNAGHGAALMTAYREAVKLDAAYVFHVDSDDQFDVSDFKKLWGRRAETPFILGFRKKRFDAFHRLVITNVLRTLLFVIFQVWIKDANIPFRLIKRDYLAELLRKIPSSVFAPNIFLAVAARFDRNQTLDIPVHHRDRRTGEVSIVRMGLIKACVRSARELVSFRLLLGKARKAANQIRHD